MRIEDRKNGLQTTLTELLQSSKRSLNRYPWCHEERLFNLYDWYTNQVQGVHDMYVETTLVSNVVDTYSSIIANSGIAIEGILEYDNIYEIAELQSIFGKAVLKVNKVDGEYEIEILNPLNIIELIDGWYCYSNYQYDEGKRTKTAIREHRTMLSPGSLQVTVEEVVFNYFDEEKVVTLISQDIIDFESEMIFVVKNNYKMKSDIEDSRNLLALDCYVQAQQYDEVRIGKGKITVPPSMLKPDAEGNMSVDLDQSVYTLLKGNFTDDVNGGGMLNTQFSFRPGDYETLLQRHEKRIYESAGISSYLVDPSSIKVTGGTTATEVVYSITLTRKNITRKMRYLSEVLEKIKEEIGVNFIEGIVEDLMPRQYFLEIVREESKWRTLEDTIAMIYPELNPEELKAKVKQIAVEKMIPTEASQLPTGV